MQNIQKNSLHTLLMEANHADRDNHDALPVSTIDRCRGQT